MLKIILFAILAIGLNSCHPVDDANKFYSSLLPDGDPLFDITNENVPQKVRAYREGTDGLAFYLVRREPVGEVTFKYIERIYLLQCFKIRFDEEAAVLEIIFEPQDKFGYTTNIMVTTTLSDKTDLQGDHGVTADPITVDMVHFLLGSRNPRGKSTVLGVEWIAEYIKKKKPIFIDIQQSPLTLMFYGPPMLINTEVFSKLRELKDRIKPTYGEQFLSMVGIGDQSPSRTPRQLSSLKSFKEEA